MQGLWPEQLPDLYSCTHQGAAQQPTRRQAYQNKPTPCNRYKEMIGTITSMDNLNEKTSQR